MPFRQHAKRVADSGQRDANTLRNFDNRHRAQNVTPVAPLIAGIPLTIDQPLNIDIVARKSGYSKWYLQRMFRTVMHQTLGDYIRQRRLLLAAEALRTTQRPIFDIAMDLGYVSQQTFSRVFRREFDRTPSDYRHQISA